MIKHEDAIRTARSLIGTPYSELDCINLIKKVIRKSTGGVDNYTTAGTNTLWRSYDASPKYRDLTWRQAGLSGAKAGMIAFKATGDDYHHAGIVTERGTVIHSSSTHNGRGVVETPLLGSEGWTHLAIHRHVMTENDTAESEGTSVSYKAQVKLNSGILHVRNEPGEGGDIIGRLNNGAVVTVLTEFENGWRFVSYGDSGSGYVSGDYLVLYEEPGNRLERRIVVKDSKGNMFRPDGEMTVYMEDI